MSETIGDSRVYLYCSPESLLILYEAIVPLLIRTYVKPMLKRNLGFLFVCISQIVSNIYFQC